ncbi:MerR family transcriptional regulator [Actinomadura sp. 9N407]|uniref:MerR family transcriptional regulator n=1 Tax=Actinomadura sp. 9N407 TaxID=3375154 RepID=UPI0037B13D62
MLIGELASRSGTTIKALRYYEQEGLLHPRRAPNGYREYDESVVTVVGNIRLLLSLGLTAADARAFVPCLGLDAPGKPVCPASAEIIARRLSDVQEKIAALNTVRESLTEALAHAEG